MPDAAKYLGLGTATRYRLIDEDLLPAYRMGRVIRIKVSDLDAFIAASRVEPGTLTDLYPPRNLEPAAQLPCPSGNRDCPLHVVALTTDGPITHGAVAEAQHQGHADHDQPDCH